MTTSLLNSGDLELIQPEDFAKLSRENLLALCRYQHQAVVQQGKTLQDTLGTLVTINKCAFDMTSKLFELVDLFEANDQQGIERQLKSMSANRAESRKKAQVH